MKRSNDPLYRTNSCPQWSQSVESHSLEVFLTFRIE